MKIESVIDNIATKYITQASFNDLMNLNKKDYCNKLVILTSKIIKKRLNNMEIDFLDQRTKKGVEINKMAKGNVLYFLMRVEEYRVLYLSSPCVLELVCQ